MPAKEYNYALWRRKETTAVVKLFPKWTGNFIVRKPGWKDMLNKFDAEIKIAWGGISGQADAIRLWFSRALIDWNSEFRLTLKPYGLLKRDPRIKERKKPGLKKARKGPTRSKR
jgi:small subunit ribosomal protein S9